MRIVTALLPLAVALYFGLRDALLMASGKMTFAISPLALDGVGTLLAIAWAAALLKRKPAHSP